MSIQSSGVKVCDLRNGRIEFNPGVVESLHSEDLVYVTVTDARDVAHEVTTNAVNNTVHLGIATQVHPIRSLRVSRSSGDQVLFEAQNLFPSTDQEFEAQFKSHRDRSGDRYVDYFVASQIFNHFTGEEGYRISAAVAAAYKAIEILDDSYLADAENMLVTSLSVIPNVKLERSTRNNREHLHISVLCALYHVHLARGNSDEFLRKLQTLRGLLKEHSFESYYNLAYNGALSLRLFTLLQLLAEKRPDARRTSTLSFQIFKLAARDADENLAHFKELRAVHDNAYESMRIARRVKEVNDSLVDKTLRGCLRVSANEHPQSYDKMRKTFLESSKALARL
ncbi:hypothetical protein [Nesterenkonia halotolerans]|uniref:Uncharacterized protein n=1 Tax=Nesterenkonia halotolerans TaxID=225325 RepID=A0ABR9JA49_9MICC|nr:hypothetical protein [Nesterenkonia halotolerans]MBE1515770.1 hypothetical protein [Nesterenkonia halotolerans]